MSTAADATHAPARPAVAVTANFTADPLEDLLRFWLETLELDYDVRLAPYNQVFQQLLDPTSAIRSSTTSLAIVLVNLEDWSVEDVEGNSSAVMRGIDAGACVPIQQRAEELVRAVEAAACGSSPSLLVCFCPPSPSRTPAACGRLHEIESRVARQLAKVRGVTVMTSQQLQDQYPVAHYYDAETARTGHLPYTPLFFSALATAIARRVYALTRSPYKVVVLDCDQTLWQGVCGEDGAEGVCVDSARRHLQQRLCALHDSGLLLCLCSKNSGTDVWQVFEQNRHMLLRREQFVAARINWQSKSQNLRAMAAELQLGLDSFVFLDDNAVECAEVRAHCPEVLTLQLPAEDTEIPAFLDNVWALDVLETTEDDRQRTLRYQQNARREQFRSAAPTLKEFLDGLELDVAFSELSPRSTSRVAQLTQRTNQFNFTTIRRSEAELQQLCSRDRYRCLTVDVKDRFGDYGLIGVVIYRCKGAELAVDTFLLSCRALGRTVERRMMQRLGEIAAEHGCETVAVTFRKTPRNAPAEHFLDAVGAQFKSVTADGAVYRFPPDFLAKLPLYPSETGDSSRALKAAEDERQVATERRAPAAPWQRITWIATELRDPARVLHLVYPPRPRPRLQRPHVPASSPLERQLAEAWKEVLRLQDVGVDDPFTDLGGTSLQLVQLHSRLARVLDVPLSLGDLFSLPTIAAQAKFLASAGRKSEPAPVRSEPTSRPAASRVEGIAVIGISGRFPGANDYRQFWRNLVDGATSIRDIADDQLQLSPGDPILQNPNFVRKSSTVDDADKFDARFFGIYPKEAQLMDPQHRLFLECCWHALEDAGYAADDLEAAIGVFAGCYMNTYILSSLDTCPSVAASLNRSFLGGSLQTEIGNDKDYLATRVAYHLNLRGPSMTVQTACSTSLVAVVQACQSILCDQCDMALAGGVTLKLPQNRGYLYTEDGMVSPDGVCRAFDAEARGTIFGEGAGVVLLKRLSQAIADGDDIYAVIKGWGINNDGQAKIGYTAPSVHGQSAAIARAHRVAGITADTISYVEAHGTGTPLGDPIEIEALTQAFRRTTEQKQFCAIGSVKTNIGHLDVAAGVTGLIKVCLAMRHGMLPPSLNFTSPNPKIDFQNSPFYVAASPTPWPSGSEPRRAGISSFGVGGTNAHVVVEEPHNALRQPSQRPYHLIRLSARSSAALQQATDDLVAHLRESPEADLADVCYTLQNGRRSFPHTRLVAASTVADAVEALASNTAKRVFTAERVRGTTRVAFMFPGQGSQHVGMTRDLYRSEPVFAATLEQCAQLLEPFIQRSLLDLIFSDDPADADALNETAIAQPAIFSVSYALSQWWKSCGVRPAKMVGHSVGEFVAACVAGVMQLEDALRLVAQRGRLMQQLPSGTMMALRLPADAAHECIRRYQRGSEIEVAAVNSPSTCVVSGPTDAVDAFAEALADGTLGTTAVGRRLQTSHAFHSAMMDPAVEQFSQVLRGVDLRPPQIPVYSTVTGRLLSAAEATDIGYWARQIRETVRFSDALLELLREEACVLLEVGPGQALTTLARQTTGKKSSQLVLSSAPHASILGDSDAAHALTTLGRLWQAGVPIEWSGLYAGESRRRVHLPGYPFERKRFWFDNDAAADSVTMHSATDERPGQLFPVQATESSLGSQSGRLAGSDPPDPEAVQRLIRQQLQLLARQLELWRAHAPAACHATDDDNGS